MKNRILTYLKFTLFLAFGGLLIWLAVRGQDIDEIKNSLRSANYSWAILSMFFGVLSHVSRAVRWNMLIHPLGYRPKLYNTFFAVMIGYFANLAFPRLGEVTKCGVLKKYEDIPVNKLLGTMIVERSVDFISLVVILVAVVIAQFDLLSDFMNDMVIAPLSDKVSNNAIIVGLFIGTILLMVMLFFIFFEKIRRTAFYFKLSHLLFGVWEGIKSIKYMENKYQFIFHSVFIWVMYFLMTYVMFFAFDATANLGLMAGLAILAMGSIGMVAPVQGGIGAYHFMTSRTLEIYGVPAASALAFAFVVHAVQTFMLIIFGFISLILLPILNKRTDETVPLEFDKAEATKV